jgi:uncharacterized phage-associated protein
MPIPVATVADLILARAAQRGQRLSNLKLQKLLYYAQGYHLAATGEPLFDTPVRAWDHGPVVPEVWHLHRTDIGWLTIDPMPAVPAVADAFDATVGLVLDEFLGFSAEELRAMSHDEAPWRVTRQSNGGVASPIIPVELIGGYFRERFRLAGRHIAEAGGLTAAAIKERARSIIHRHDALFRRLS